MDWTIDHAAIAEAARGLGIKKPVTAVKSTFELGRDPITGELGKPAGRQGTGDDGHVIMLNREVSDPVAMNKTIWHELRHCHQRELLGDRAALLYETMDDMVGYEANPMEVDAEDFAYAHIHIPLIKVRR